MMGMFPGVTKKFPGVLKGSYTCKSCFTFVTMNLVNITINLFLDFNKFDRQMWNKIC